MGVAIQILLPFFCMLVAESYAIGTFNRFFNHLHDGINHMKESNEVSNKRPINGDMFSYNNQHAYSSMYHDGNFIPDVNMFPYFGFAGPFGMGNLGNMAGLPYGFPNIHNQLDLPGRYPPNKIDEEEGHRQSDKQKEINEVNQDDVIISKEKPDLKNSAETEEKKTPVVKEKLEEMPPKTNKIETDKDNTEEKNKEFINLNANKDYLLVGNNGNGVYLLHENTPNVNTMTVPNNNLPTGNNVVYVPYNPQQSPSPVYQLVSGQPPAANIPIVSNKLDLNNVAAPVQSQSNNDPSYVLIYANGQLIQIPGIAINSPPPVQFGNQGSNVIVPNNNAPMPNYVYANPQNQANGQIVVQVPNTVPLTNNMPNNAILVQNPAVSNNIPNTNFVTLNNQPNSVPQQSISQPNNMNNGYVQPNVIPTVGNQGPIVSTLNPNPADSVNNQGVQPVYVQVNTVPNNDNQGSVNNVNPNPSGSINNLGIQPALSLPVNVQNNYQSPPAPEKDVTTASSPNATPSGNDQPGNTVPVEQTPNTNDGALDLNQLGIQPAVMVSGFKENDDNKDKKKSKKEKKNKDKKKK